VAIEEVEADRGSTVSAATDALEGTKVLDARDEEEVLLEHEAETVAGQDVLEQLVPRHVRNLHRHSCRTRVVDVVSAETLDPGMDHVGKALHGRGRLVRLGPALEPRSRPRSGPLARRASLVIGTPGGHQVVQKEDEGHVFHVERHALRGRERLPHALRTGTGPYDRGL
jgi:hypothetical protein